MMPKRVIYFLVLLIVCYGCKKEEVITPNNSLVFQNLDKIMKNSHGIFLPYCSHVRDKIELSSSVRCYKQNKPVLGGEIGFLTYSKAFNDAFLRQYYEPIRKPFSEDGWSYLSNYSNYQDKIKHNSFQRSAEIQKLFSNNDCPITVDHTIIYSTFPQAAQFAYHIFTVNGDKCENLNL